MTLETIIIVGGGLVLGLAGAIYARWSRAQLERDNPESSAE